MLPSANPQAGPQAGPQQDPPSSQGGGMLQASPDALQAQAALQQPPPAPPELSVGAKSLISDVVAELKRRYRDPSFVVPLSIKEPPIATQLPGLIEGGANAPIAFPAQPPTNLSPAMGFGLGPGGQGPVDPMAALLGGPGLAPGGMLPPAMGPQAGPQAGPNPSRILNEAPLGFNPEDVLLM